MSDLTPKLAPELSPASRLRHLTPARIGLRTTGLSLATSELLDFQLAHARARDAVHAPLQPATLRAELQHITPLNQGGETILLHSAAADRQTYLKRPDLGRNLSATSLDILRNHLASQRDYALCIVIADGLSALAVERHAVPLLAELLPHLESASLAPICIVEQARVAVGDQVAQALRAALAIVLIGERPGLTSPDSLGAYITWLGRPDSSPRPITDADRNCISNIRAEGLSYPQAAARLLYYIQEARSKQLTGVALKDPELQLESGFQPKAIQP
jgi:ethanolamine ammonia-lyase small subunit